MLSQMLKAGQASSAPVEVEFIGHTSATFARSSNFTVSYPAGTQDGDIAVICIGASRGFGRDYTSAGWTVLNRTTGPDRAKAQLSYRVVSGTGNQTFSGDNPVDPSYILAVFRNTGYSAFSVSAEDGDDAGNILPNPPFRSGTFNAVLCFGVAGINDTTVTAPTGYTLISAVGQGGGADFGATTMAAYTIEDITNPNPSAFTNIDSTNDSAVAYTVGFA